jgi:hypothetical protein
MEIDAATQHAEPTRVADPPKTSMLDILSAVVLGASALATTYASYQAELWDGEQAALYTEANALRVEASQVSLRTGQIEGADLMAFGAWLSAYASSKSELEEFYLRRFRPEFSTAFNAWAATQPRTNPNAPPTPFVMPGYNESGRRIAADMEQQAHEKFAAGQEANRRGDQFVLATVILANALFFGGINQLPHSRRIRTTLLATAIGFCLFGITHIAMLSPAP